MNISLTPELDSFVQEKLQTGMYHSASEVVRAGLRLLLERDSLYKARLQHLREEVDIGIRQIENGQFAEYTSETLPQLASDIKSRGRKSFGRTQDPDK